jgi:hypothetical protein
MTDLPDVFETDLHGIAANSEKIACSFPVMQGKRLHAETETSP